LIKLNKKFLFQYEVQVVDADGKDQREIFYGKLDYILECQIPDKKFWPNDIRDQTKLLAVITPCVTGGKNAAKEATTYDSTTTQVVTDLAAVGCVVGRAFTGGNATKGKWGIIDRSGDLARTEFVPSHMVPFNLPRANAEDSDGSDLD